jgi:Meiotically Up-regulated Gene 113 (MUG113) protein
MSAVYFLNAVSSGWIKIEYSKRPLKRVSGSNTFCPHELSLLKVIEGGYDIEKEMAPTFKHLRGHGEWFRAAPELLEAMESAPPDPEHVPEEASKRKLRGQRASAGGRQRPGDPPGERGVEPRPAAPRDDRHADPSADRRARVSLSNEEEEVGDTLRLSDPRS